MITKVKTASREEWKALRHRYIGGSDAAAVVGLNPFCSPFSLWAEKTGRVPGFEGNLTTEVGAFLEEFVAQKFAEVTGKRVRRCNQSLLNSDYPFAIANIDREIVGEDAGLEIKTTSEMNLKKFKGGEFPANYYCQCMHYLAMTGRARWYLAVLIGNREFRTFTIERDEDEIAALMESEREFWQLVQRNEWPNPDGMSSTGRTLDAMYPESEGGYTEDVTYYTGMLKEYVRLGKRIGELKEMQDTITNNLKAALGECESGECEGFRVSWKSGTRRSFDAKRFEKENPDIDTSDYYKETPVRTFRITEKKGA